MVASDGGPTRGSCAPTGPDNGGGGDKPSAAPLSSPQKSPGIGSSSCHHSYSTATKHASNSLHRAKNATKACLVCHRSDKHRQAAAALKMKLSKVVGRSTHDVAGVLTSPTMSLCSLPPILGGVAASAVGGAGADLCTAPLEDKAGKEGKPGEMAGAVELDPEDDAGRTSSCCAGWRKDEEGESGHVDGAAGAADSVLKVGEPFEEETWRESAEVTDAEVVPGVEVVASRRSRLVDGISKPPPRRGATERGEDALATRGHTAPSASAGAASALHVAEQLGGSLWEIGEPVLAAAAVAIVASGGERGAPVSPTGEALVLPTAGSPSNLAALSCSQRELLPGVMPSRRRWHSSHGHLPSGPASSPNMQ